MSASSSGSAPPWLEACLGGGASARLQAGGLQAFGGEHRRKFRADPLEVLQQ